MKKLFILSAFSIAFLFLNTKVVFAQFEQKLTFSGSIGFISGGYEYDYLYDEEVLIGGPTIDLGILYNFNRKLSFLTNFRAFYLGNEYDIQLGIGLKYNFNPMNKFNFYVFAEPSINYYSFEEYNSEYDFYDTYEGIDGGFYPGLGFDYRLTDNLGIFAQGGVNVLFGWGSLAYGQLGVRVNLLKSKDL